MRRRKRAKRDLGVMEFGLGVVSSLAAEALYDRYWRENELPAAPAQRAQRKRAPLKAAMGRDPARGRASSTNTPGMRRHREAGKHWFKTLRSELKWELGDALVLGDFDWRDWLDVKPSRDFMAGVIEESDAWEQTR